MSSSLKRLSLSGRPNAFFSFFMSFFASGFTVSPFPLLRIALSRESWLSLLTVPATSLPALFSRDCVFDLIRDAIRDCLVNAMAGTPDGFPYVAVIVARLEQHW